jgi:PAS domain S-box-containing protein
MTNAAPAPNRRVLVIDDNPAIHEDFRKILMPSPAAVTALDAAELAVFGQCESVTSPTQVEITSAYQGQEGVALVRQAREAGRPFALAFIDVRMPPGWDGVETARRIWELDADIQVVLCTAYSDYSWSEMYQKLGQRDGLLILKKPFDAVEALQLTHALTEKWQLHQEARRKMDALENAVAERTRELAKSFSLLHATLESTTDGIVAVDLAGKVISYNAKFAAIWQFPPDLLARADVVELRAVAATRVKDANAFLRRTQESQSHPEAEGFDLIELKDGRTFERYVFPQRIEGGCVGTVINWRDITERKRNETAAQAFSKLGQRLSGATTAREAFGIISEVSRELFGWDAFCIRLYDVKSDAIVSGLIVDTTTDGQLVTSEQVEPMPPSELYRRVMAQGGEFISRDEPTMPLPGLVPFGNVMRKSAVLLFVPIRSPGRVLGILTVQSYTPGTYQPRDLQVLQTLADQCGGVFERIWAEEALRQSQVQLFQAQKLETVGHLAGGIAHEFNSIMTVLIGQSDLLLEDLPPGNALRENAQEIGKAAQRAATLTRQLLAYGRKQMLRLEVLDLNEILVRLTGMILHLLGTSVEVQVTTHPGTKSVRVDAGQMEQVIVNLVMNAADAMPEGGQLTLETLPIVLNQDDVRQVPELKPGEHVLLIVSDTGVGMSETVRNRAFEPFFTTKDVGKGTGLGLSTCYGIIKQSGGHIAVHSEPGQGTTFRIYLPVAGAKAAAGPATSTRELMNQRRSPVPKL